MAYSVVYKGSVKRDLKKIDKAVARRMLDRLERDLLKDPQAEPVLKGEFAGLRKYRVGDFRVVDATLDDEIRVLRIAHRKDVYR